MIDGDFPLFAIISNDRIFLYALLVLVIALGLTVMRWIYRDAKAHGSNVPLLWTICIGGLFVAGIVPGLLAVIVYLLARDDST